MVNFTAASSCSDSFWRISWLLESQENSSSYTNKTTEVPSWPPYSWGMNQFLYNLLSLQARKREGAYISTYNLRVISLLWAHRQKLKGKIPASAKESLSISSNIWKVLIIFADFCIPNTFYISTEKSRSLFSLQFNILYIISL